MKNKTIKILVLSAILLPVVASAVTLQNPISANSFAELITKITQFLKTLAIPLAVVMIVVAGFYFITASGDPAKINTAKQMILWTFIGLGIVLMADALANALKKIIGA